MTTVPQATELPPEAKPRPLPTEQLFATAALISFPCWMLMAFGGFLQNPGMIHFGVIFLVLAIVVDTVLAILFRVESTREAARARLELAKNPRFAHLLQAEAEAARSAKVNQHQLMRPLMRSTPMLLIGVLIAVTVVLTIIFR